jgi:adenylate cyclase, class 2
MAKPVMSFINIEIKAKTTNTERIREYLLQNGAEHKGTDFQTDTYFNSHQGRLKLREGNIENNLIYYEREDKAGPKQSNFSLLQVPDAAALKSMLAAAIGIKITVEKKREIYFINNVKFHLDSLDRLGEFVEIEASNKYADLPPEELKAQCEFYVTAFGIAQEDLLTVSYSDLLLQQV